MNKLDSFFKISERGSTVKTEIIGGLTTFFAMCYIIIVNPSQMSGGVPVIWQAAYVATALGAIIGTLLMGLYAKMPYAQAPGMGLNSFFFVSFMLFGFGTAAAFTPEAYQAGLSVILLSGLLFMILSFTGIRKKIVMVMPMCLKKAIPAGIGLFIAYIAFQNSGLIVANQYTQVQLVDLTKGWYVIAPPIITFLGFLTIGLLSKTKLNKGSVIIAIVLSTALYYLFNIGNSAAYTVFENMVKPSEVFKGFGSIGIGGAFKGFAFWKGMTSAGVLSAIMLVITFCLVDMFDTYGTLQGTATEAGMLDADGNPKALKECLISDSTATVAGAILGTSNVTTFVESAAGVSAGARTGLSSVIVAVLFFITMFLSPIASIIPSCAVAPALIYVGVLMLRNIRDVDFTDMVSGIPAFLAVIMMPLTYSISNGIGIGMISYIILKVLSVLVGGKVAIASYFKVGKGCTGDFFSKDIVILVIAVLFALRFFLVAM